MSGRTLRLLPMRATPAPRWRTAARPVVVLSFVGDRYRVRVLGGPGDGDAPTYDKALRYATRIARQNGWGLVNLSSGRA